MDAEIILPSLGRMSLTSTWLESLLFGINCILFGACIHILTDRHRQPHWILYVSCAFHMSISTAHAILAFIQLLDAFTGHAYASIPHGADIYFATPNALFIINLTMYVANVFAQDLLLIWRLYIVWGHNRKLLFLSLFVEAAHIACAIVSVVLIAPSNGLLFSSKVQAFGKASWTLDLFLNTTVTCGIAYPLWRASIRTAPISNHSYQATMYTVIESGALIASCTVIMFALDVAGSPAGFAAVNVAVQVATTTPLLIIVRLGLGLTHGKSSSNENAMDDEKDGSLRFARPVQVNVTHTQTEEIASALPRSSLDSVESDN
ncbi:hypothetical protein SERLA73DRAFT_179056 [Serpula lacrymans var. lacrymans S7.3]|uniref:Uncharacterized protein n=2 Tax=Serpula lacrymans var. lacrymans TaxID=341189 RepID=F8PTM7_SERL3|nr:uncharacterized protein SERLADRAFT_463998 [Serpula lacrymans var. lacrymans S7.9]EGO01022.1 hypothetical protein SERLA73DRAFT_179056 [Serpula lacrymans var. lacrymans S7.3]EGO26690.1 hypothetical protein SERLADRAFT_463998 [Serpula lacrymans var. lacrymans S7.9]